MGAPERRDIDPALLYKYIDLGLFYPGLDIYLFNDKVADMVAKDARWRTPSGLRLGMTEAELFEVFGMPAQPSAQFSTADETVYDLYFCNGGAIFDLGTSFRIHVGQDGIVNKLSFGSDTP